MVRTQPSTDPSTPDKTRRRLLAATGSGALAATAGCVREVRSIVTRDAPSQLSLDIKTAPADADPRAIRIARYLATRLAAVGIDASIVPMSRESLFRDVLLNQSFDLYVAPFPGRTDPDFLYSLLHSRFAAEPGWQNPVGYANLEVDRLLDRQRRQRGADRQETLAAVQRTVARDQPFSVVAFPDEVRAVRDDRVTGWDRVPIHTTLGYLGLDPVPDGGLDADAADARPLTLTLTDSRPTENLNPLAVELRSGGTATDLLYDSLGRWVDGSVTPWLAAGWTWSNPPEGESAVTVRLREDMTWHDGTDLTADDVAFTYAFLADTSLGRLDSPVPAPRFRGRGSIVTDTAVLGDRTVRLTFEGSSPAVAARSLTVPLLPRHVWESKAEQATVAGLDLGGGVTRALVWRNVDPVGSGPFRVERRTSKESLVLAAADDHFLRREAPEALDDHLAPYAGGPSVDRLAFTVVPSGGAGVELVDAGEADATASPVLPASVPTIGRSAAADLVVDQPRSFYHVGYNLRRSPTSSTRFRRAVARLLDEAYLTETVFDGFGQPAVSPLARHDALAPGLAWTGEDPVFPFPGTAGELDVDRAREPFREAGYRYSEDGALLLS
ncbi:ABC transporter substrate-binding protein [Halorarius litoreus]|uniref:ABC transporter substrate-binding protein n=1 Tax=Halorarius litoreus TaxID=2962676 RepID=UPI0020CEABED|nr:ABC transporter substrate-binding protein [Halorarius litoreus]